MKIKSHVISLKSKHPFRITHGVRTETLTYIIEISDGTYTAFGEATPVPYYGVTPEVMDELLAKYRDTIQDFEWEHPSQLWSQFDPYIGHNRFLQCAIDMAAYDLWAQRQKKPLYKALGLTLEKYPLSNYTIGIDEIPKMIEKMKEIPFPIYKIKLGTEQDIEIIKALRSETSATLRVDANTAWTLQQAIDFSSQLKDLGVEFIEQPLKADNFSDMEILVKESALPIIADESCITESDVDLCLGKFHGINIKLAKCGGITPALRMIQKAKENNMLVMMGCMTETSIGISGIAHLLPLLDFVDMDGTLLISNDPADGVKLDFGKATFPNRNGIGAFLK